MISRHNRNLSSIIMEQNNFCGKCIHSFVKFITSTQFVSFIMLVSDDPDKKKFISFVANIVTHDSVLATLWRCTFRRVMF